MCYCSVYIVFIVVIILYFVRCQSQASFVSMCIFTCTRPKSTTYTTHTVYTIFVNIKYVLLECVALVCEYMDVLLRFAFSIELICLKIRHFELLVQGK